MVLLGDRGLLTSARLEASCASAGPDLITALRARAVADIFASQDTNWFEADQSEPERFGLSGGALWRIDRRAKQFGCGARRPGAAQKEPLDLGAACVADAGKLFGGLNAFGGRCDSELPGKSGNRSHDSQAVRATVDIPYERLIDLDFVEREAAKIAQARVARAEVIKGDAHAK